MDNINNESSPELEYQNHQINQEGGAQDMDQEPPNTMQNMMPDHMI